MKQVLGYMIYHAGIFLYGMLVKVASLWNAKAKLFVNGRNGLLDHIAAQTAADQREKVWFHCASLGEFEQARPLMEYLRREHPQLSIVVTFFSPSGYEIRKNYAGADHIFYLPQDSAASARRLVSLLKPVMVFFVKYEVWYHYLRELKNRHIPVFLISANFRTDHVYFKWYGTFFYRMLLSFDHIFCQNEASAALLARNGITHASVSRDTRFDRVAENSRNPRHLPLIETFKQGKPMLVAGSSYTPEETIIAAGMKELDHWKIVIAPHHIDHERITEIMDRFAPYGAVTFSALSKQEGLQKNRVLVIDNIGMLSAIYQYGDVAFIGGGFGKSGLHNILEAAVFGMPVLFGPNNLKKFPESLDLVDAGAGFVVHNGNEFSALIGRWNTEPGALALTGNKAAGFIISQTGATAHIVAHLENKGLLKG
jgi:3-deoxy-D-manno-octulosonic-acid transferase